ncbi:MAG: fimbrillin family protein [Bacteroidaceae bacterium]|nr:fimbrillin family protein [Bacteroidaceae bacterium]
MKKYIYIALAAAAFASCSQDEALVLNQEEITFGDAFVNNATRAIDPSYNATNKLTAFKVWGAVKASDASYVSVFADDAVSGTVGTNSVWNCTSKTQYWIPDAMYDFAAVVNADTDSEGKSIVTLGDNNKLPATITYTADGSTDLLYARSKQYKGLATNNPKVQFDFAHLLAKVKFTLNNTTPKTTNNGETIETYTYTLTDIKISNAIKTGVYTVADVAETAVDGVVPSYTIGGSWATTTSAPQAFDAIEGVTNNTDKECANEKLLIPLEDPTVECDVNLYYGGKLITTTHKTTTISNLDAGHAYNVIVEVGLNNPIQFTVEQDPSWTPNPSTEVKI